MISAIELYLVSDHKQDQNICELNLVLFYSKSIYLQCTIKIQSTLKYSPPLKYSSLQKCSLLLDSNKSEHNFLFGLYLTIYSSQSHDFNRYKHISLGITTYPKFPFLESLLFCSPLEKTVWMCFDISIKAVLKPSAYLYP